MTDDEENPVITQDDLDKLVAARTDLREKMARARAAGIRSHRKRSLQREMEESAKREKAEAAEIARPGSDRRPILRTVDHLDDAQLNSFRMITGIGDLTRATDDEILAAAKRHGGNNRSAYELLRRLNRGRQRDA